MVRPLDTPSCRQFAAHIIETLFAQRYQYDYDAVIPICEQIEPLEEQLQIAVQEQQQACASPEPEPEPEAEAEAEAEESVDK